ncbi:MAG: anthranilate phosphoribosyltransferase [Saprospiraceae bacterium]
MKKILTRLFNHEHLSRSEAQAVLTNIATGKYNPVQVSSFITVFNMRPITADELSGFRDAMVELCIPFDLDGRETIDIVGTGGDGKNTFNISTTSAFVIAGAGYQVTKHGSYGVSSAVGSSNVLMGLGYEFTNQQDELLRQLDKANLCFLHAPIFHPAMKEVVPIRKQLAMKSFFNMLGPLVNPGQPTHQLFGTFNLELARLYQYILQQDQRKFAVVYALDGYDEISLTGDAKVRTPQGEQQLSPADFGKPQYAQSALYSGETVEDAAKVLLAVLNNEATAAQRDVVCANAGLAISVLKPQQSLVDCVAEAEESIGSEKALEVLKKLVS